MAKVLDKKVIKLTFDATGGKAIATHPLDYVLPSGAVIVSSWVDVRTTFTSATDAGTIALSTGQGAGDLVAAIAISDGTNVWDSGIQGTLAGTPTLSTFHASNNPTQLQYLNGTGGIRAQIIKLTANRIPTVAVAVEALTAGVMDIYIEYVL